MPSRRTPGRRPRRPARPSPMTFGERVRAPGHRDERHHRGLEQRDAIPLHPAVIAGEQRRRDKRRATARRCADSKRDEQNRERPHRHRDNSRLPLSDAERLEGAYSSPVNTGARYIGFQRSVDHSPQSALFLALCTHGPSSCQVMPTGALHGGSAVGNAPRSATARSRMRSRPARELAVGDIRRVGHRIDRVPRGRRLGRLRLELGVVQITLLHEPRPPSARAQLLATLASRSRQHAEVSIVVPTYNEREGSRNWSARRLRRVPRERRARRARDRRRQLAGRDRGDRRRTGATRIALTVVHRAGKLGLGHRGDGRVRRSRAHRWSASWMRTSAIPPRSCPRCSAMRRSRPMPSSAAGTFPAAARRTGRSGGGSCRGWRACWPGR